VPVLLGLCIIFVKKYPEYQIFNLDALTYANLEIRWYWKAPNYTFIKGDIVDATFIDQLFEHQFDVYAESHVDRSITDPLSLWKQMWLEPWICWMQQTWNGKYHEGKRFIISVPMRYMEVWVPKDCLQRLRLTIQLSVFCLESKFRSFVRAYGETYGLPYVLTNCLITTDLFTFQKNWFRCYYYIIQNKPLPVYGDGKYTRDWFFVEDHAVAIDLVFHEGKNDIIILEVLTNGKKHWFGALNAKNHGWKLEDVNSQLLMRKDRPDMICGMRLMLARSIQN
jgi:dTDP-glucose 4,6-dehydratase